MFSWFRCIPSVSREQPICVSKAWLGAGLVETGFLLSAMCAVAVCVWMGSRAGRTGLRLGADPGLTYFSGLKPTSPVLHEDWYLL